MARGVAVDQLDHADVVVVQLDHRLEVEFVHVQAGPHRGNPGRGDPGGVLDAQAVAARKGPVGEPADRGFELARDIGRLVGRGDEVAARHVEVVGQVTETDRPDRRLLERAVGGLDLGDGGALPLGEDHDLVAGPQGPAVDHAGVAATAPRGGAGPTGPGGGRPSPGAIRGPRPSRRRGRLEGLEDRRPAVPGRGVGALDHVVAVERRDRDHRGEATRAAGPAPRYPPRPAGRPPCPSRRGPSCWRRP